MKTLIVFALVAFASDGRRNSGATITASYGNGCHSFTALSTKDISHVEIHYADGRVVKDETINRHDYSIAGDDIEFAIVKSGTSIEEFPCVQSNSAPVALLEIETPPIGTTIAGCYEFFAGGLMCEQSSARVVWISARDIPDTGGNESGLFHWGCGALSDPSVCSFSIKFRGANSSDEDDDITSWSIDFGDGTSASGAEVTHDYSRDACAGGCVVTLTVTDSSGHVASDSIRMAFVDQTPD